MNVSDFYSFDYQKTLFPLESNRLALRFGEKELRQYVKQEPQFCVQTPVAALKKDGTARKTVKLDPIFDFILYDFIIQNQTLFQDSSHEARRMLGYHFADGHPCSTACSFNDFQYLITNYRQHYRYFIKLDIQSYFNSINLDDFMIWLKSTNAPKASVDLLEKSFRKINLSENEGFLPQGIYPTKVLGSHYLSFIEKSGCIHSDRSVRFLDDIYVFSNSTELLFRDFHDIQHALHEKGLMINASKTHFSVQEEANIPSAENQIHSRLDKKRLQCFEISDGELLFEGTASRITNEEQEYIISKANRVSPDEQDISLLLTFLRDDADSYLPLFEHIIYKYPFHTKSLYFFIKYMTDHRSIASILLTFLQTNTVIAEYQLFWITRIVLYLSNWKEDSSLLLVIYNHPSASDVVRSKILEIPTTDKRILELSRSQLTSCSENLPTWCAAFGQRGAGQLAHNPEFNEFSKSSPINSTISAIVRRVTG